MNTPWTKGCVVWPGARKVFLEALEPTSETLHRVTETGYDIRVLVAANRRGEVAPGPAYLTRSPRAKTQVNPPLTLETPWRARWRNF